MSALGGSITSRFRAVNATILLSVVTLLLAGALINRVAWTAEAIDAKAKRISASAGGIQDDAVAVAKLDVTNRRAGSILQSAQPLQGKLAQIVQLAQSVDGTAKSIDSSAGTVSGTATAINTTAGAIGTTATGINGQAASILDTARSIQRGTAQINTNLDVTIAIVEQIKGDTANILGQALHAHKEAACIDDSLPATMGGASSPDGHCR